MNGLLTGADGSREALVECRLANLEHEEKTDPRRALIIAMWAQRDLDRLQFDGTWGSRI